MMAWQEILKRRLLLSRETRTQTEEENQETSANNTTHKEHGR